MSIKCRLTSDWYRLISISGLFALLFVSIPAFAQLPNATILGVVKDASGAVIPGATVTIRNTDTGLTRTVMVGDDGSYRVPALPVGMYSVSVESMGFKTLTRQGLTLEVATDLVVNATLEVGETTQTVTVTEEAPLVDTTNSTLGTLMNEQKIENLPLNGRNYTELAFLQPGVTQFLNSSANPTNGGTGGQWFSSNGGSQRSNMFTVDGTNMMNMMGTASASASGNSLGVDGIKEFKTVTSALSAEYGGVEAAQVQMVSKGGTNQFHGDVFDYVRNSALDARSHFDYGSLIGEGRLPPFQRNQFGAAIGGPIKKDNTFFYAVYEGLRSQTGIDQIGATLPAACHNLVNPNTNHTTLANPAACSPTLTGATIIPQSIQNLLPFYAPANFQVNSSTPQLSYVVNYPSTLDFGQFRLDHTFSSDDSIFVRYTVENDQFVPPSGLPQYEHLLDLGRNTYITLGETHIFSSALVNTGRLSFSRIYNNESNVYTPSSFSPASRTGPGFSFTSLNGPIGAVSIGGGSPGFFTVGFSDLGAPIGENRNQTMSTGSDDVYYTRGRHGLKFGGVFSRVETEPSFRGNELGSVSFADLPSFMAGIYQQYSAGSGNFDRNYFVNTFGLYAQDDFRATSRLTLNLGLRWEGNTALKEANGRGLGFQNIATDPQATVGLLFHGQYHNFGPRVGFAYDVFGNGKTAIRGGVGILYDVAVWGAGFREAIAGSLPVSSASLHTFSSTSGPQTFPTVLTFTPTEGATMHILDPHAGQPRMLEENLTVQQQLPGGFGVSVSFIGTRGYNIFTVIDGNPKTAVIVNGQPCFAVSASITPLCGSTPSVRTNPNFSGMELVTTAGNSWYDGLQVIVNKRLGHGLQFQGAYTWSKSLDTTESATGAGDGSAPGCAITTDPLNINTDKGPSCFDVPHVFHLNTLYNIPSLHSNNFAAKFVRGWWIANVVTLQDGTPFTPIIGSNRSNSGNLAVGGHGNENFDLVSVNTAASIANPNACSTTPAATAGYAAVPFNKNTVITGTADPVLGIDWYNPNMFNAGCAGFLGSAGRGILPGPGYHQWDFTLAKDTALGESRRLEFRAEFFNIANITNYGEPGGGGNNSGKLFSKGTGAGPFSEAPKSSGYAITSIIGLPRQIQLSLKFIW
jgi:Carboxypeptidase regulatory-like domain